MYGLFPNLYRIKPDIIDSLESEDAKKQIQLCEEWITNFCEKTSNIRNDHTSYYYKHRIEDYYDNYVSNGAFIQAAINLDYKFKQDGYNSPNAYFNLIIKNREGLRGSILKGRIIE